MTTNRFRTNQPAGSGVGPVAGAGTEVIMNLADVADCLRCSPEEAQAFLQEHNLVGVEFPSGPRYIKSDILAAFQAKLQLTRVQKSEASKLDGIQNTWVVWLNKVQASLTPSEQDGWVRFARTLVSKKISPVEFFRRSPEDRQNLVRISGIDFRLRDDYGNAHVGLEAQLPVSTPSTTSSTRTAIPPRSGSKPFGS